MTQPIGMKRRKGRPKNTTSALIHQPCKTVDLANQNISEDEEECELVPCESQPAKRGRGRPKKVSNKKTKL